MTKPIKRHIALQPLSREHHFSLLLCWKIRQGLKNRIAPSRIMAHVRWHFNEHIRAHFELEEKHLFPIIGMDHELVLNALDDHKKLVGLFHSDKVDNELLAEIESLLNKHIRFEERVLFKQIENVAEPHLLNKFHELHNISPPIDNEDDPFWN